MAKKTLGQLQARFGTKPGVVELVDFADIPNWIAEYLKEGGTSAALIKEFGEYPAKVYEILAKEGRFYMKPLLSGARDEFESSLVDKKGERNTLLFRAKLVSLCWCQKDGTPMGTKTQIGTQLRADLIDELFKVAQKMNHIGIEDVEEAGKD